MPSLQGRGQQNCTLSCESLFLVLIKQYRFSHHLACLFKPLAFLSQLPKCCLPRRVCCGESTHCSHRNAHTPPLSPHIFSGIRHSPRSLHKPAAVLRRIKHCIKHLREKSLAKAPQLNKHLTNSRAQNPVSSYSLVLGNLLSNDIGNCVIVSRRQIY